MRTCAESGLLVCRYGPAMLRSIRTSNGLVVQKVLGTIGGKLRICLSSREVIWGGGESFLHALGAELTSRGIEVRWRVEPDSELARRIPKESMVHRRKRATYDLLIANDFRSFWQAVALDGPRRKVFVGHGPWQFSPVRVKLLNAVRAKTFVVSDSVAAEAVAKGFTRKPEVLPLGPNARQGVTSRMPRDFASMKVTDLVFGCVARLDPIKRLPVFVRAIEELGARSIVVVPEPASPDEALLHQFLMESANIELRTGGDVDSLWDDVDVFLSTSKSESLGLAHLEALQSGIPVISTAANGPGDFLTGELRLGWIPHVEMEQLSNEIAGRLALMQSASKAYWSEATRVLESRSISRCADLILGTAQ